MELTVTLSFTDAQARVLRTKEALARELGPSLLVAVRAETQAHLDANYVGKPNRLNAPTTEYWRTVRDAAQGALTTSGGAHSVSITLSGVGLRMKWHGGVIRPTGRTSHVTGNPIRFLTIPVNPLAYGKTVSDFGGGLKRRGAVLALDVGNGTTGYGPADAMFILVKQAVIRPDKNILPPAEAVLSRCRRAVKHFVEA